MKNYEEIIKNNALPNRMAEKIALSQKDLGGKSQKDMAYTLGFFPKETYQETIDAKIQAFDRLDSISQFIVIQILSDDNQSSDNLNYAVISLRQALDALNECLV